MKVRLPLYGPARAEGPLGPLSLRRKALGILYYLALEGPTRRERLADLLWGHGAALQNLRVELTYLRGFLGKEALRGQVLELPPGVVLDRNPKIGEALEGLEEVSPAFADWVRSWRERSASPLEALPLTERLQAVQPPALVILIGPPGSGREALAQALAKRLGLPFRRGLGQGPGVFYFGDPLPPREAAYGLRPTPGQVLVVARSAFGEDPAFLLVLRGSFPAEITVAEPVPRLTWPEAWRGPLRGYSFPEAARFYLESGGRAELLKEMVAMGSPEAIPQRIRAQVLLEARYLSLEARKALEVLSLHPSLFPEELAEVLGVAQYLDELERRGWLVLGERGYRFAEPQFCRFLIAELAQGERLRLHRLMAEGFRKVGDPVAEAYHRYWAGEDVCPPTGLRPWQEPQSSASEAGVPWMQVGLGPVRALEAPQEAVLVSWGGEEEGLCLELEEPAVLHISGNLYQELPFGLGLVQDNFPLRLRGGGYAIYFLPRAAPAVFPGATVLPQEPLDYRLFLPPGPYRLELGVKGVAHLHLRVHAVKKGQEQVLALLGQPVKV